MYACVSVLWSSLRCLWTRNTVYKSKSICHTSHKFPRIPQPCVYIFWHQYIPVTDGSGVEGGLPESPLPIPPPNSPPAIRPQCSSRARPPTPPPKLWVSSFAEVEQINPDISPPDLRQLWELARTQIFQFHQAIYPRRWWQWQMALIQIAMRCAATINGNPIRIKCCQLSIVRPGPLTTLCNRRAPLTPTRKVQVRRRH